MAHPVIWSPQLHFYPIGNTPATSLTEYIPPDEDATILVLGCGDPRNTLFTIASESHSSFDRALDFTFCDSEPAVPARNVIIYTLLYDQCDEETIKSVWKIYFDIFIDKQSFDLLASHCRKIVELSSSLESWNEHPYGTFIRFCTAHTLSTLRRYWNLYIFKDRSPVAMKADVLEEMKAVNKQVGTSLVLTSLRAAGIMALSNEIHAAGPAHHAHYWKHGVTNVDPAEISRATHVNPTVLYSSGGSSLRLHYGTDPIVCFHLAPALALMQDNCNSPAMNISGILEVIQAQFRNWCQLFNKRTNSTARVILRFFSGNAMSLCKALRCVSQTGSLDTAEYTSHYGASTISFVDDYRPNAADRPPVVFNIIETSNLSDHLNLLLISAPLLKRDSCSVLFTHSLIGSKGKDGHNISALQKLEVEPPLLSLLLGLVPERAVSEVTSQSNSHELMTSTISASGSLQLFEFNCWRVSSPEVPGMAYNFTCDPSELGSALFATYLNLFADEVLGGPVNQIKHVTRDTFTYLLSFSKDSYIGDWRAVASRIISSVENNNTLIVGMNYYQELCRALHFGDLYDIVPNPQALPPAKRDFCFQGWEDIPTAICIVLVVPRANIQHLIGDSKQLRTPPLQCEVLMPDGHSAFTSFQPTFGTIEELSPSPNKKVSIHEDIAGWAGKSDLIVHFLAPAWLFVKHPLREYNIGLNMYGMSAMLSFMSELGMNLSIYSTSLANPNRAFILRDRPRTASEAVSQDAKTLSTSPVSPMLTGILSHQPVDLKFNGTKPISFTIRCPITDESAKATLLVKSTQVEVKAISVTAVQVSFEGFKSTLHFPYPVDTSALITRIARKSSYIEIEGRVAQSAKASAELNPFPVIQTENGPRALRMHYLYFENLPAFRSPILRNDDFGWLQQHFIFSVGEEKRRVKLLGQKQSGLLELKESIMTVFLKFFNELKGKPCIFHMSDPDNGGTHTMFFVSRVRLDLTAHTVVADACVLPLTIPLVSKPSIQRALSALHGNFPMAKTTTPAEEVRWWKAYLPTAVERCRTWKHGKHCEYIAERIPRSLKISEDPICSCGRGKNVGNFSEVKEWSAFKPFVTRVALGIPFSTALLGELVSEIRGLVNAEKRGCAMCGKPGKPKLMLCARCKGIQYCSVECQRADWKQHKKVCSK